MPKTNITEQLLQALKAANELLRLTETHGAVFLKSHLADETAAEITAAIAAAETCGICQTRYWTCGNVSKCRWGIKGIGDEWTGSRPAAVAMIAGIQKIPYTLSRGESREPTYTIVRARD